MEIGKVKTVELVDGGKRVRVKFDVDRSIPLYQSTTAQIRYLDLIGNRYLELKRGDGEGYDKVLSPGGFIPLSRTTPALDLDALIGGFKPVFKALSPDKVNDHRNVAHHRLPRSGRNHQRHPRQTAQLTNQLAERDRAIGEVVKNLNTVLDTTVRHRKDFDQTVNNLEVLITGLKNHGDPLAAGTAHISNAAGTVAELLAEDRASLHKTVNYLDTIQQPLIDQRQQLIDFLPKVPSALNSIGRGIGSYGDFVNFYACDITPADQRAAGRRTCPHRPALPPAVG